MINTGFLKLPFDSGPKLGSGAVNSLVDLAVGGNFVCCIIGLGRAYWLGEGGGKILNLSYGGKLHRIFMWEVDQSRHHGKILIWPLEEG